MISKHLLCVYFVFVSMLVRANICSFEATAVSALTNNAELCGEVFSNQISLAEVSSEIGLRVDAYIMRGVRARCQYFETAEISFLCEEKLAISNAVVLAGNLGNDWRRWTSGLLYAGSSATLSAFEDSYQVLTNGLCAMTASGFSGSTNSFAKALVTKMGMDGLTILDAYKVMAGLSAAELGLRQDAQSYARQVPARYSELILRFTSEKCR